MSFSSLCVESTFKNLFRTFTPHCSGQDSCRRRTVSLPWIQVQILLNLMHMHFRFYVLRSNSNFCLGLTSEINILSSPLLSSASNIVDFNNSSFKLKISHPLPRPRPSEPHMEFIWRGVREAYTPAVPWKPKCLSYPISGSTPGA